MLLIDNPYTSPYFNIALEEHLLKQFDENIFMLYRNTPSIIVGKHQNTLAEINAHFVRRHNLPVVRRISGGGTVYHDLGNLNYTFLVNAEKGKMVDFQRYAKPIVKALAETGINAYYAKTNSLFANGLKISGNAEHVFKQRVLHHGTLLFNANLEALEESLRVEHTHFQSRAVQSIRSKVTNISGLFPEPFSLSAFSQILFAFVKVHYSGGSFYTLQEDDIEAVERLVKQKYGTDEWNFGYSPSYAYRKVWQHPPFNLDISLKVNKGIITEAAITDRETNMPWNTLNKVVENLLHQPDVLAQAFAKHLADSYDENQQQALLNGFFG